MTYSTLAKELNEMKLFHFSGANRNVLDLYDRYKEIIEKSADRIIKDIDRNKTDVLSPNYNHTFKLERLTIMMSHCYATAKVKDNKHASEVKKVKTVNANGNKTSNKVRGITSPSSSVFGYINRLEEIKNNGSQSRNEDSKIFDSEDVHIVNQICLYELERILLNQSKVVSIADEGVSYCDKNYPLILMELRIFYSLYDLFMKENHGAQIQNPLHKIITTFIFKTRIAQMKSRIAQIENIQDSTMPKDRLINLYNMMIEQIETQALKDEKNTSSSVLFKKAAEPKICEIELTQIKKTNSTSTPIR